MPRPTESASSEPEAALGDVDPAGDVLPAGTPVLNAASALTCQELRVLRYRERAIRLAAGLPPPAPRRRAARGASTVRQRSQAAVATAVDPEATSSRHACQTDTSVRVENGPMRSDVETTSSQIGHGVVESGCPGQCLPPQSADHSHDVVQTAIPEGLQTQSAEPPSTVDCDRMQQDGPEYSASPGGPEVTPAYPSLEDGHLSPLRSRPSVTSDSLTNTLESTPFLASRQGDLITVDSQSDINQVQPPPADSPPLPPPPFTSTDLPTPSIPCVDASASTERLVSTASQAQLGRTVRWSDLEPLERARRIKAHLERMQPARVPVPQDLALVHQRAVRQQIQFQPRRISSHAAAQEEGILRTTSVRELPHALTLERTSQSDSGPLSAEYHAYDPPPTHTRTDSDESSMSDLELDRSSPVPAVEEESDDEQGSFDSRRLPKGTGPTPLPPVKPAIVQYICARFRARVERARQLSATPAPYGVAYRDVLRLRIIGSALAELGIGTGKGERRYIRVQVGSQSVRVKPDHVMITLGMHPSTYRSVRSRMDKVQSVYTWLGQNKHLWEDHSQGLVAQKLENRAYQAMKALFGPKPLPTRQHIPEEPLPAGTHDALWEPCKTFLRWAAAVAEQYDLKKGVNLPVSPEFYDIE